jgi:hypothetical protein
VIVLSNNNRIAPAPLRVFVFNLELAVIVDVRVWAMLTQHNGTRGLYLAR